MRVIANGQTTGGAYLAAGDVGEIYCDGTIVRLIKLARSTRVIALTRSGGAQSITTGTAALITVDTETGDVLGEFSAGASSITLKNTGKINITAFGTFAGTSMAGLQVVRVYKNGEIWKNVYYATPPSATTNFFIQSTIQNATAGDVLTFYASAAAGTGITFTLTNITIQPV